MYKKHLQRRDIVKNLIGVQPVRGSVSTELFYFDYVTGGTVKEPTCPFCKEVQTVSKLRGELYWCRGCVAAFAL